MDEMRKTNLGAKTLLLPTPVLVVGSYDEAGEANMMTAAWGGICCSSPPCVTVSLRKATYSYNNLMEQMAYTINIPSKEQVCEADYFGIASGRNENKIKKAGYTPVASGLVNAPYLAEFGINLECRVLHVHDLGLHTQFIGEVLNVKVDQALLEGEASLMEQLAPIAYSPHDRHYYTMTEQVAKGHSVGKRLL